MTKPDWCPQRVWDEASNEALKYVEWLVPTPTDSDAEHVLAVSFARAILAAEQRVWGACAALATNFATTSNTRDLHLAMQEAASADTAEGIATAIRNRSQDQ